MKYTVKNKPLPKGAKTEWFDECILEEALNIISERKS